MALFSKETSEEWNSSGVLSMQMTYFSYAFIASAISCRKLSAVTDLKISASGQKGSPKVARSRAQGSHLAGSCFGSKSKSERMLPVGKPQKNKPEERTCDA